MYASKILILTSLDQNEILMMYASKFLILTSLDQNEIHKQRLKIIDAINGAPLGLL